MRNMNEIWKDIDKVRVTSVFFGLVIGMSILMFWFFGFLVMRT